MQITLTDSRGKTFATVSTWEAANIAARAIFKRQYYSDLFYTLKFDDGEEIGGVIDLEPASFHRPHQRTILTTHLHNFWGNVSRLTPPRWDFTPEDINRCKHLLTYLPAAA